MATSAGVAASTSEDSAQERGLAGGGAGGRVGRWQGRAGVAWVRRWGRRAGGALFLYIREGPGLRRGIGDEEDIFGFNN